LLIAIHSLITLRAAAAAPDAADKARKQAERDALQEQLDEHLRKRTIQVRMSNTRGPRKIHATPKIIWQLPNIINMVAAMRRQLLVMAAT
jgi:hypothetical protein